MLLYWVVVSSAESFAFLPGLVFLGFDEEVDWGFLLFRGGCRLAFWEFPFLGIHL